ncbi:hypothetical protein MON38_05160 [Hymenobacter sp. DH14]|uniref:Uncharacterized protein n=1 Tax=Hymenobacter cyanobacteriorum TaxID=2926463 RepID=A0A9X1VEU0_9BACT|nr:hypothetical protein [Hymenobacter cyanobacteriorum]MCI1186798.1 hypothetical protein [Hymenobacter cyanobacteriorum]
MCPNCFSSGFTNFPSYRKFEAFEAELHQKLSWQQLHRVAVQPATAADFYEPDVAYRCAACTEVWALSPPDNAWRGYFLPVADAKAHRRRLRHLDTLKGIIGLAGLLALATLLYFLTR